jgi:hypothetical protein
MKSVYDIQGLDATTKTRAYLEVWKLENGRMVFAKGCKNEFVRSRGNFHIVEGTTMAVVVYVPRYIHGVKVTREQAVEAAISWYVGTAISGGIGEG